MLDAVHEELSHPASLRGVDAYLHAAIEAIQARLPGVEPDVADDVGVVEAADLALSAPDDLVTG